MRYNREFDSGELDHKTLEAIRTRAVKQALSGKSPEEVADAYGMNRKTIYRWLEKYHYGGLKALKVKPSTRKALQAQCRPNELVGKCIEGERSSSIVLSMGIVNIGNGS